ncbi:MAG: RNB domain-containing ribonuclease [Lentisphaerae bacterium]|nr:RNB domain-containing ribonuclease [Lentisphaerota bacterium]
MRKDKKKRLQRLAARRSERKIARKQLASSSYTGELLSGTVAINPAGYGFVKVFSEDSEESTYKDYFVPAKYLNGAMHGDTVRIAFLPPDPRYQSDGKDDRAAEVLEVVKRARQTFVGVMVSSDRVRPLDKRLFADVLMSGNLHNVKRGDWVEARFDYNAPAIPRKRLPRKVMERRLADITATLVRRLGPSGVIQADLDAICTEYDLPGFYTLEEEAMAQAITPRKIPRRDLSNRFTLTIDPFDAKDYDDAVSLAAGKTPDTIELGVHIAEVAAWIEPESYFDRKAAKRGFTAYLPGRTINMLPKGLTAKISMTEGVTAPAHSVILQVERASGRIISAERLHSTICVNKQLDYDTVQRFFDTSCPPDEWSGELCSALRELLAITQKMRLHRRQTEQFLDLEIPEIRILCDEKNNKILGLQNHLQRPAEELIEECMLAANSAVATELADKHIPGLYRIHPEPDPEKLEEFAALSEIAFNIPAGDLTSRSACRNYLQNLPDTPAKAPLLNAFLRSLPRATYQHEPGLHYGLGKVLYSHFTSPIRRYPDLLLHQQLWQLDCNLPIKGNKFFEEWAQILSELENNNDDAYFAACNRMKLRYLDEMLTAGKENIHEAMIVKITASGVVIELPDLGLQGFINACDLPGGYRSEEKALRECHIGKVIFAALEEIDFIKATATFRSVRAPSAKK